ncbi:hypothetical protein, partial [Klebsiella variicola]
NTAIAFAKYHDISLAEAVQKLSIIPIQLNSKPYRNIIWDPIRGKMIVTGKKTMTDLLCYLVGLPVSVEKLSLSYAKSLGENGPISLPSKIIK